MITAELTIPRIYRKPAKRRAQLPTSWEECRRHALFCVKMLANYPEAEAKLRILRALLPLNKAQFLAIPDQTLLDLVHFLSWMKLEALPVPLIDRFKCGKYFYFLPKAQFEDGIAIEYPLADEFMTAYFETGEDIHLHRLTATLCRLHNEKGDRAPLQGRGEVLARAKTFAALPAETHLAVLLYFAGVKKFIFDTYGDWLFNIPIDPDEPDDDDDIYKNQEPVQSSGAMFGWWGVYMDVAESNVFGNLDQVHQTNFHTLCMYLVKKKKAEQEQERALQMARMKQQSFNH